jgi:hypothetical protein
LEEVIALLDWDMPINRKKVMGYRFNGYRHCDPGSIHSVGIPQLHAGIKDLEAKLADPNDVDDKRWVARWLKVYAKELEKKRKGLFLKLQSKRGRGDRWKDFL